MPGTRDGTIPAQGEIVLGFRLYIRTEPQCVILFFHGNSEIADDYDGIAEVFFSVGTALLVVDYRGYGWSTGTPLVTTLLTDAEAVMPVLPDILKQAGLIDLPVVVMGRSLGSAPAIHLTYTFPNRFSGLIVESGFADMPSLFYHLHIPVDWPKIADVPVGNVQKMRKIELPLLVIHGETDHLLPVSNGQRLYEASPSNQKTILRIPRAGHNDLLYRGFHAYHSVLSQFVRTVTGGS